MTNEFDPNSPARIWFRREQGKFLRKARLRAGLSLDDVKKRFGIDLRELESGRLGIAGANLIFLIKFYKVPEDYFATWQIFMGTKMHQMRTQRPLH